MLESPEMLNELLADDEWDRCYDADELNWNVYCEADLVSTFDLYDEDNYETDQWYANELPALKKFGYGVMSECKLVDYDEDLEWYDY